MNPQAMMNMLLNQLKMKNPQGYNYITNLMNSGQNPQAILNNMLNSGQVTKDQIEQIKNLLNNQGGTGFSRF